MLLSRFRQLAIFFLVSVNLGGISLNAAPAQDRDSLLRLVGDDAGVVIEIDNLRDELKNVQGCEVLLRLQQTMLFHQWQASKDFRQLIASRAAIEQLVGKPLRQFVGDIFGESVVIAVYPTANGQAEVVLITRAIDSAALDTAMTAWNLADRSKLTTRKFGGHEYVLREKKNVPDQNSPPPQYTARFDNILVFSNSENAVRRVISLKQVVTSTGESDGGPKTTQINSFLSTPAYSLASEALPRQRFVTLHINPRVWDDRLDLDPQESKVAADLLNLWKRCNSIAFALSVSERGLFVDGVVHSGDIQQRPDANSTTSSESDELPAFLMRVPRRAVALFAGRHDLAGLATMLLGWIPDNERDDFNRLRLIGRGLLVGFDLFDDIVPALGKDWGVYLVESKGETAENSPLDAVLGVELPPPGQVGRGNITVRDSLDNALQTTLQLIGSYAADKDGPGETNVVTESHSTGTPIHSVDAGRSLRPAFALTDSHLVVGTSPTALKEFVGTNRDHSLGNDPAFVATARRLFPRCTQLMYIDVAALRDVIDANKSLLSDRLSGSKRSGDAASLQRVRSLNNLLQTFDIIFVAGRTDGQRIHVRAGIAVNRPVDK